MHRRHSADVVRVVGYLRSCKPDALQRIHEWSGKALSRLGARPRRRAHEPVPEESHTGNLSALEDVLARTTDVSLVQAVQSFAQSILYPELE